MRDKADILADIISGEHTELEEIKPPPQRLPGVIRWMVRCVILPFVVLDFLIQRFFRFLVRSPYRLKGKCKCCGVCCRYILLEWSNYLDKFPLLGKLYIWWLTEIDGFYLLNFDFENEEGKFRLMSCRYLSDKGVCKHYYTRSAICRQYPWIGYFRKPWFLPKCGYK